MAVDVKYRTSATATGGRDGSARTDDGAFVVRLSTPKELGGRGGDGRNPEQLFAAGYAACFLNALKAVAGEVGVRVPPDATVRSTVGIGPRSEGGYGLDIDLQVALPNVPHEEAQRLDATAHQVCPYSNAIRNNVDVRLSLAEEAAPWRMS